MLSHSALFKKPASGDTFHLFPKLPTELCYKIWASYLQNTTPQMYTFRLRYYTRLSNLLNSRESPERNDLLMGSVVYLRPIDHHEGDSFIQYLKDATVTYRTASAVCIQARRVVLEILPDTLTFRDFPVTWTCSIDIDKNEWISPDAAGYPARTLRFSSVKDIVVFKTSSCVMKDISRMAFATGKIPEDFLKIRHVGIDVTTFEYLYTMMLKFSPPPAGTSLVCKCPTTTCRGHCTQDPITNFLSLFPLLKRFCIVDRSDNTCTPHDDHHQRGQNMANCNCRCPLEHPQHICPSIRSADTGEMFTVYDERTGCHFPKYRILERLRQQSQPHSPYYKALEHLDIAFVQTLRSNGNFGPQSEELAE